MIFSPGAGFSPNTNATATVCIFHPLREERTPSFKVDYVQNLWYDFGLGEGGTLRTLVMRLERCDSREAIRRLQNGEKKGRRFRFSFTGCWRASSCRRSLAGLASGRRPRAPDPLRRSASSSGIGRLSLFARHRPVCCRGILPRGSLRGKRPRLFSPSGSATMPEGGSSAPSGSKAAPRPNTSPPSTTVPTR